MDLVQVSTFFSVGLGLGVVHAFDPDHLAAVAGLNADSTRGGKSYRWFGARWALGHGIALLLVAVMVLFLGVARPDTFSQLVENSVAYLLIALGVFPLWRLFMRHSLHNNAKIKSSLPQHSAPLVGLVHGVAGSAPFLALLPLTKIDHPAIALSYVLFFSAGVALAMTSLGALIGISLRYVEGKAQRVAVSLQMIFALGAIVCGVQLLLQ
jgi:ABC-type nickel/cobalt efflux system permease component RcnA